MPFMVWYGMVWYGMVWYGMAGRGQFLYDFMFLYKCRLLKYKGRLKCQC